MDLKEIDLWGGGELCWIASRWGQVTEYCEKFNEILGNFLTILGTVNF